MEMNYTSDQLFDLLKDKYKSPKGSFESTVILPEVPNGTGGFQSRWIDAAVFEMWPSKGLSRSAFEIKVTRSDFLRELQQPEKHRWCKECFHYFWFIAPKDVCTSIEELPAGSGWMYPAGTKLCIKKHATRNDTPRLDDKLLAAFMRAANKQITTIAQAAEREALKKSPEHLRSMKYEQATTQFLTEVGARHSYSADFKDSAEIVKALHEAKTDKGLQQDRDNLLEIANCFQRDIVGLMNIFLVIANKGLLARNDLGEHLVSAYGGITNDNVSLLKKHLQDNQQIIEDLLLKLGETP